MASLPEEGCRAVAANSGPVILPRMVQGAIRTRGLFRMRLYFPGVAASHHIELVIFLAEPDRGGNAVPFLRTLIKETYFWP